MATILTVGHSTHAAEAFLELLRLNEVASVADVRRYPGSRRMPWFNQGELERSLEGAGIAYEHLEELGGRRPPLAGSPNDGWRVGQFQGYADHMASAEFEAGLERLLALEAPAAAMCAEARWTSCHRRLLSDALVVRGHDVRHILSSGRLEPHALTDFAVVDGGHLTYPPAQASLDLG